MKLALAALLTLSTPTQEAAERGPRETVEHFLELLGGLRHYALAQYMTEDANIVTSRDARSAFANRSRTAADWIQEMQEGGPRTPFAERLSNVTLDVQGELALMRADFEILRGGVVESSGVDFFTLVKRDGAWKIASIAYSSFPALAQDPTTDLERKIASALDALDAKSSMYAKHLPTGREVSVRADEPMNTLSVIKLPVMLLAFRDAAAGKLDLDERYTIRPEDRRRGSGLLQTFAPGLSPTYRDLVTQMIITSDNSATDILIGKLGLERVNALLDELRFRDTRLNATTGTLFRRVWELQDPAHASMTHAEVFERGFPNDEGASARRFAFEGDREEWLGRSTARDTARFLEGLYRGSFASREASDAMIGILERQFYRSRLPRDLPPGVSVAHKTGDWPPVAGNDVGILLYDGGPTIVAVYVNQNRGDFDEVEATIGRIARWLIEAWGGSQP